MNTPWGLADYMFRGKPLLNLVYSACVGALLVGCRAPIPLPDQGPQTDYFNTVATQIEYPDIDTSLQPTIDGPPPRTLSQDVPTEFWDLSVTEALSIALQNSEVLKDLGGRVVATPDVVQTVYDPAIQESDPRFGPEGALSAFDAQLGTTLFWQKNDRVFNNAIEGGGINEFQRDVGSLDVELSKLAATGTRFSARSLTDYDRNNVPRASQIFPESWNTQLELSLRHPLLQGSGLAFNRIAGPNAQPGFFATSGVLVARVNTDISIADFEAGVIDFLSNVENAYWELYFAYRDFDAAVAARDRAGETWQAVRAKYDSFLEGGEAYREARSRGQFYAFQRQVQDALSGPPAGSLRGQRSVGIYGGERRLRWLMGLPASGPQLVRPSDEPSTGRVFFDWTQSAQDALAQRVELRRQKWLIQRREMELIAARHFIRPRLDAVAAYRLRGFGNQLTGNMSNQATDPELNSRFASAFKDFGTGDHQEWEAGLQLQMPLGFRQGWAAVRRSELQVARARAILDEQEKQVLVDLGDAFAEVDRAFAAVELSRDELEAGELDVAATQAAYDADQVPVGLLLESQQRLAESQRQYFRSLTDYAIALKNVHVQKGTLLPYDGVSLQEGNWPSPAYGDAYEVARLWPVTETDCCVTPPGNISQGPFQPMLTDGFEVVEPAEEMPPRE